MTRRTRFLTPSPAAAVACLLLLASTASAGIGERVRVAAEDEGGGVKRIVASNGGPAPVAIAFALVESENFASDQTWPFTAVIPPNATLAVARAYPARPGGFRFTWRQRLELGDPAAVPDPGAAYRLPYADGRAFVISQAAGGNTTTHKDAHNRYAVDFTMPVGTPVVAARDGLVVDMETERTAGGRSEELLAKANFVTLLHSDGSLAEYAHLSPGQVVQVGRWVAAGTVIGYSGNTGYSSGPHLHFNVYVVRPTEGGGIGRQSLPVTFHVGTPPVRFTPRERLLATADYSAVPVLPAEIPARGVVARRQPDAAAGSGSKGQGIVDWVLDRPWLSAGGVLLLWLALRSVARRYGP